MCPRKWGSVSNFGTTFKVRWVNYSSFQMVLGPFHFKGCLGGPGIFISYAILKCYFNLEVCQGGLQMAGCSSWVERKSCSYLPPLLCRDDAKGVALVELQRCTEPGDIESPSWSLFFHQYMLNFLFLCTHHQDQPKNKLITSMVIWNTPQNTL